MSIMNPDTYKWLPIGPLPRTQALNTKTFRVPPLDGSLTVPEMYDWHLENSPEHPLFVHSAEDGTAATIKMGEAVKAMHRAGRKIQSLFDYDMKSRPEVPYVAFVANSDTVTFFTTMVGVMRTGMATFPISTRNSPAAVAHLLEKTRAPYLLVGPEPAYQELVAHALELLKGTKTPPPRIAQMPLFEDLYAPQKHVPFEPLPAISFKMDDPVLIMHSSGSTSFPKPVPWTNYRFIMLGIAPYFGEQDLTGCRITCHGTPMFHAMGNLQITVAAAVGVTVTAFKPQSPARLLTEDAMIQSVVDTKSEIIVCVPRFLEMWARNPVHVDILKRLRGVCFGGGPLAKDVGDEMVRQGVQVLNLYGASETGIVSCTFPAKSYGKDWEYFRFPNNIKPHFVPEENGNVELVLLPNPYEVPNVLNYQVDGVGAYNTNDVLAPHPKRAGLWKIFGRSDDQIMHSTGEKTNPGPLEHILNQDPHVQVSLMFGRGRFNAGVLIEPKEEFKFDPIDQAKLAEFRNKIWPTVERMNEYAPQHSRVFKEMITVSTPAKPFTYTAKNTPRRQAILREYEPEIEAVYAAVDETTQSGLAPPSTWNPETSRDFVRAVVAKVLEHSVGDTEDLFQSGADSLQATWIRNSILRALRETTEVNTRVLPNNFVYRYPTVAQLASFVSSLTTSDAGDFDFFDTNANVAAMIHMVDKYSKDFPKHVARAPAPKKDVILLTGTTGGLGSSLLSIFVNSPAVERVYALNRKSGSSLKDRQAAVLEERGLDARAILDSPKVRFLETELGDHLGLPVDVVEEMRSSVTHIIHNAWPVNFNLSLTFFEPSVATVRQLIDLALSSPLPTPPTVLFISSVGIFRNIDLTKPVKEGPVDASVATGTGYGESKWVSERILKKAAEATSLHTISVRVGQLTGATSGAWKVSEWFPSLVCSSVYLKCLPDVEKDVSWIPVDAAARAIDDMRNSHTPSSMLHLAHPRPVPWRTVLAPLAAALNLPTIPYDEWCSRLEASAQHKDGGHHSADSEVELMRRNPALKLLDFYNDARVKMPKSPEAMGLPMLEVARALEAAPSLGPQALPQLSAADVGRWIEYWRRVGAI